MGQTSNSQLTLVSDHPAVRAAVERYFAEQTTATATSAKSVGARFATTSPVFGGGYQLQTPPVALRLNRAQYEERDVLQALLVVLATPGTELPAGPVTISTLRIPIDFGSHLEGMRGTYAGMHVLLPGQMLPLETYIFDGSEPSGLYVYVVVINDAASGQTLVMPVTTFVFRNLIRNDNSGYVRVDSAESNGRYLSMRGNFSLGDTGLSQFVVIAGRKFPVMKSDSPFLAMADLGNAGALPPGVHDITLVVFRPGNTAYDSTTTPCVLRLFLPPPSPGKG